jgi:D-amino peptidase
MRKLFISADMEGCAAVSAQQARMPERWAWEWAAARRWMTAEVVATAEAAFAAGFNEVIVADSHGNAHNIDPDVLPDNVRLVRSWPRPLMHMQGVESSGIAGCAFVGYHAGPGSQGSVLAHAYSGQAFRSVKLNGESCSEGYLNAALAGELGRSVVFVAGDAQTVEDSRRYAPEAATFVTKHSIGWRSQMSLPPAQVCRLLKAAAADAFARQPPKPFVIRAPLRLELEMTGQGAAEMLAYLPGIERVGACTVAASFERVEAVVRFVAFAMLYTPSGVPAL